MIRYGIKEMPEVVIFGTAAFLTGTWCKIDFKLVIKLLYSNLIAIPLLYINFKNIRSSDVYAQSSHKIFFTGNVTF